MISRKSIRVLFLALASILIALSSASAEYRVYQYYVKSRYQKPDDQKGYLVTSTLDPVSYLAYHGGHESLKVDLLRSWSCKGHTGEGKPLCLSPLEKAMEETPE